MAEAIEEVNVPRDIEDRLSEGRKGSLVEIDEDVLLRVSERQREIERQHV